jgi:predicted Zn-dependent protease
MKTVSLLLLVPLFLGCATATQVATSVGVSAGYITQGQKQALDKTAVKVEKAARPVSETEEYYIGRGVAATILTRYTLYRNQTVTAYVNYVGSTVVMGSPRPYIYGGYHFAVLDTDEINAFACPGGIIFVTKGMLKTVRNEDQLAAVLSHEVGHVAEKHGLQAISSARWTEVVTTLATESAKAYTAAEMASLVDLFQGTVNDVFKTLVVNGYGREQELQADSLGIGCMKACGYDGRQFMSLLDRLEQTSKHTSGGIFATHPDIAERIQAAKGPCAAAARPPAPEERIVRFTKTAVSW